MGQPASPIHSAIRSGYFQQVRFLIDMGSDVNAKDERGRTALMLCALVESKQWGVGLARTLLESGAKVFYRDRRGLNALHYAAIYKRPDIVALYLTGMDFDVHAADRRGNTALHYSAAVGDDVAATLLCRAVARYDLTLDKENAQGVTALQLARICGSSQVARVLLGFGASDRKKSAAMRTTSAAVPADDGGGSGSRLASASGEAAPSSHRLAARPRAASSASVSAGERGRKSRYETEENVGGVAAKSLLPLDVTNSSYIKDAHPTDPRNDPEYVFGLNTIEYFAKRSRQPQCGGSAGAAWVGHERNGDATWRSEFRSLWTTYEQQCSPAFLHAAKPSPQSDSGGLAPSAYSDGSSAGEYLYGRRGSKAPKPSRVNLGSAHDRKASSRMNSRKGSAATICSSASHSVSRVSLVTSSESGQ